MRAMIPFPGVLARDFLDPRVRLRTPPCVWYCGWAYIVGIVTHWPDYDGRNSGRPALCGGSGNVAAHDQITDRDLLTWNSISSHSLPVRRVLCCFTSCLLSGKPGQICDGLAGGHMAFHGGFLGVVVAALDFYCTHRYRALPPRRDCPGRARRLDCWTALTNFQINCRALWGPTDSMCHGRHLSGCRRHRIVSGRRRVRAPSPRNCIQAGLGRRSCWP